MNSRALKRHKSTCDREPMTLEPVEVNRLDDEPLLEENISRISAFKQELTSRVVKDHYNMHTQKFVTDSHCDQWHTVAIGWLTLIDDFAVNEISQVSPSTGEQLKVIFDNIDVVLSDLQSKKKRTAHVVTVLKVHSRHYSTARARERTIYCAYIVSLYRHRISNPLYTSLNRITRRCCRYPGSSNVSW